MKTPGKYIINILMSNNIVHTLYTRIIGNRCGEAVWGMAAEGTGRRVVYIVSGYCAAASPHQRPALPAGPRIKY